MAIIRSTLSQVLRESVTKEVQELYEEFRWCTIPPGVKFLCKYNPEHADQIEKFYAEVFDKGFKLFEEPK